MTTKAQALNMESFFNLEEANRAAFLHHMVQSFCCSYICLWSHFHQPPSNCLIYFDGLYPEQRHQPTLARRLFNAYCESVNHVDRGRFPGFAFKSNLPYIEFKLECFQRFASSQVQMQFYQEAGIKTIVFMGCAVGEIELGLPSELQVDLKMEIENLFPPDFSREAAAPREVSQLSTIYNLPTISSSFSVNNSSNYAYSCNIPDPSCHVAEPTKEAFQVQQNAVQTFRAAAFTRYHKEASIVPAYGRRNQQRRHSMFKRSVLFFRKLTLMSMRLENRPTPTQVHHIISERRRREKLNKSFQVLRSLLPPGSKKDKASVLSSITSHVTSLKSQVEELRKKNKDLESQLSMVVHRKVGRTMALFSSFSTNERVNIEISRDSGILVLNLSVGLQSEECGMLDLVCKLSELFKERRNHVRLVSMQSQTRILESNPLHGLEFRFKVEGDDDFDDCDFQQAVTRVVMTT